MQYLTTLFRHAEAVHRVAAAHPGLVAHADLGNFRLQLTTGSRTASWRPRFIASIQGRMAYVDKLDPPPKGFVGWTPYPLRQWESATDKLVFKRYAADNAIATPAACTDARHIGGPFLIKKSRSSFGEGIRGPYIAYEASNPDHQIGQGEYYENFILGHIVKAWYWGARWLAVELWEPPFVIGDGVSSLKDLITRTPNQRAGEHPWDSLAHLARYCGIESLDAVPKEGKEVLVDFKYGSRYVLPQADNRNVIEKIRVTPLAKQFTRAGEVFAASIDADHPRDRTIFTLDAMVDAAGTVWFLEMNSNPMIHPDAYEAMIVDEMDLPSVPKKSSAPAQFA